MTDISDLHCLLEPHGLLVLGMIENSTVAGEHHVLVGNAGSRLWSVFKQSTEFADGAPDPLDRWSRRVGETIAGKLGAEVVFPFDGPPYPPFTRWARKTGSVYPSPIGMLIHVDHGLWHAYRFALSLQITAADRVLDSTATSPCLSCSTQPCLNACPVDAFSNGEYLVGKCMRHLIENADAKCRTTGCMARRACPNAYPDQYLPDHARFHMEAFVRSRLSKSDSL